MFRRKQNSGGWKRKWLEGFQRDDFDWQKVPLAQDALAGKKVSVIGGTNGIGQAFAHTLAAKGAEVIVVGRTFRDEARAAHGAGASNRDA